MKRAHVATDNGGRDKINRKISKEYANITKTDQELFKSFCTECQRKPKRPTTKGTLVRLILTTEYCSRGRVDLIDMQFMPLGNF